MNCQPVKPSPAWPIEVRMENVNNGKGRTVITVISIVAAFLLMGFLVRQMVKLTRPPGVDVARAAARAKDNAEIRGAGVDAWRNWGLVDKEKGVVRMPIEEAMKVTVQGYKDPAGFRSNITMRLDKAFPPPVNYE